MTKSRHNSRGGRIHLGAVTAAVGRCDHRGASMPSLIRINEDHTDVSLAAECARPLALAVIVAGVAATGTVWRSLARPTR